MAASPQPSRAQTELVRCTDCRATYELPLTSTEPAGRVACPHCGGGTWVAPALVPEPRTARDVVGCLRCGRRYAKPSGAGTVADNPGCPECGYVGWTAAGTEGGQKAGSAVPLRRGSPAAPSRETRLTPPK
jgi:DNA-directed RNA polymerase subunit RPC12/RpoP